MNSRAMRLAALCVFTAGAAHGAGQSFLDSVRGEKIAAVVYAQNTAASQLAKHAQSRLESILGDNGLTVLDRKKADELKDVFNTLEDPGAFVTAETFVENAGKFAIKGLVALYLSADSTAGLADYFSATAHADIRFISEEDAKAGALTTAPMGAPGSPPSDGLTENSALINAVQRAVDNAGAQMGMEVMDPAVPRSVQLSIEGPVSLPAKVAFEQRAEADARTLAKAAKLDNETWRKENATGATLAPGGALGAVAGYIVDTDFHRRPPRVYGSRMHVVDPKTQREIAVLDCHPVGKKSGERGTREILDCMFLKNWRYLAAVTGNSLFLWDTERGRLMSSVALKSAPKSAALAFARSGAESFLVLRQGKKTEAYRITRAR